MACENGENVQIPSCVGHGADHRAIEAEYGKEASDDFGLRMRGLAATHPEHASARIDLHGTNYLTFEELDTFLFSALSAEDMETPGN